MPHNSHPFSPLPFACSVPPFPRPSLPPLSLPTILLHLLPCPSTPLLPSFSPAAANPLRPLRSLRHLRPFLHLRPLRVCRNELDMKEEYDMLQLSTFLQGLIKYLPGAEAEETEDGGEDNEMLHRKVRKEGATIEITRLNLYLCPSFTSLLTQGFHLLSSSVLLHSVIGFPSTVVFRPPSFRPPSSSFIPSSYHLPSIPLFPPPFILPSSAFPLMPFPRCSFLYALSSMPFPLWWLYGIRHTARSLQ